MTVRASTRRSSSPRRRWGLTRRAAVEYRLGQGRSPQAAALAVDDAAEGVHRRDVRNRPRGLPAASVVGTRPPSRRSSRSRYGPGVLRLPRRRSVPRARGRPPGLRCHGRPGRTTFISKAGITSCTFKSRSRMFRSSLRADLPEGPYSALAANGNLCSQKLAMPTAFTAQNGAASTSPRRSRSRAARRRRRPRQIRDPKRRRGRGCLHGRSPSRRAWRGGRDERGGVRVLQWLAAA